MKRKHGLSPIERIERSRTVTPSGCWETPFLPSKAYPSLKIEGRHVLVHRIAYEHYVGPIEKGLCVCHRCDNPRCHNPDHLFLGAYLDNVHDMVARRRNKKRPPSPHTQAVIERSHMRQVDIAQELGIGQPTVSAILRRYGLGRGRTTTFGNKVHKGEAHGRALITEADVRAIRNDPRTAKEIAKDYPIGPQAIRAIKARRTWKHVD